MPPKWKPGILRAHEDPHGTNPPNTWSNCLGSTFQVRTGPNYARTGKKVSSGSALYNVFAIDAYNFDTKTPHMGQYVDLSSETHDPRLPIPSVFIINMMIPSYAPSLMWSSPGDGEGWSLVFYCRLSDHAREALLSGNPTNALSLLTKFIHAPDDSPLRKRFKVIARVNNVDECGFNSATGSLVKKYNAKPFLARTTTSFYLTDKYFEVDIDVHNFGRPARIGLYGCREVLSGIVFDCAFVVEGVDDDELPEQILCATRFTKLDVNAVPNAPTGDNNEMRVRTPSHRGSLGREGGSRKQSRQQGTDGSSSDSSTASDTMSPGRPPAPSPQLAAPPFVWRKSELPPRYQDILVRPPPNSRLRDIPITVEGDPIEGGMLMINVDLDRIPNVTIRWFRDRRLLDCNDTLAYIPTIHDVGKRLGVALATSDVNEELRPWWESEPISPALPEAFNLQLHNCKCGQDAWIEYSYFGGAEGRSRCTWLRSRDGRRWDHIVDADDKNMYSCSPNDLNYRIKCMLTPVRSDNVKGPVMEVEEFCGLSENVRAHLIESLIPGSRSFEIQIMDPPNYYSGQLNFNHRYVWVMAGSGHDKHKIISGKFKRSCRIMSEPGSDIITLLYVDKHNDKELIYRFKVPAQEVRADIILSFRLYMSMALEDIAPEFVGPEVFHDWYKGKFEAYQLEQKKPSLTPFLKMKPNCHHRLRLALERPAPTRVSHALWRGPIPLPEDAINRFQDETQRYGIGWIMARDALIAVMKAPGSEQYTSVIRSPDTPPVDRSVNPPPLGPPSGVSLPPMNVGNASLEREGGATYSPSLTRNRNTIHQGGSDFGGMQMGKPDVQQQIILMQRRLAEVTQRSEQLAEELRSLRQDIRANRGSINIARGFTPSYNNDTAIAVLFGMVAFLFFVVGLQYYGS